MPGRVLVNGCFDPIHFGHVLHFEMARQFGDTLIVSVTSDESVRKERGSGRPLFNSIERLTMVRSLRVVDEACISDSGLHALQQIKPDVFVKGCDYSIETIEPEIKQYCEENNIEIRFTDTPKWSATEIGNVLRRG